MKKINLLLNNRTVFKVFGSDCIEFLNTIVTSDLKMLKNNEAIASALLSPQGRVLFDMLISIDETQNDGDKISLNIECDKKQVNELIQKINLYNLRKEIEIINTNLSVFITNEKNKYSNTYLDKRFFDMEIRRIYTNKKNILIRQNNRDLYDFLRFKNSILEGPYEIKPNTTLPLEINLDLLGGISFNKGCFIGQEVNARVNWRGLIKKKCVPVKFKYKKSSVLDLKKIKDRRVFLDEIEIGELVSTTVKTFEGFFYGVAKIKLAQLYLFEKNKNLKGNFLGSKVNIIFPNYLLPLPKKM